MISVLLFGAAGQVGSDCLTALQEVGFPVIPITRKQVDFAQAESVMTAVKIAQPNVVINACAYTAVDKAEEEPLLADQINHKSVDALAQVCNELSIPLIHISTDYVFDGKAKEPYKEEDLVNPASVYGQTKLAGERAIQNQLVQHIILRTSWVFGEHGHNFVKTMLRLGAERDQLKVVHDQLGCPTYVGDIVSTIVFLCEKLDQDENLPWGVYHCCSKGVVSWYEFACAIFDEAKKKELLMNVPDVIPIPTSGFPTPAPRPAYSVLQTNKLCRLLDQALPSWQVGLSKMINFMKTTRD